MRKELTSQVRQILRDNPETRNSDALLVLELYKRFYYLPNPVKHDKLLEVMKWAQPDHLSRIRQKIQNVDGQYLPTSTEVIKQRRLNQSKWRSFLGYQPPVFDTL